MLGEAGLEATRESRKNERKQGDVGLSRKGPLLWRDGKQGNRSLHAEEGGKLQNEFYSPRSPRRRCKLSPPYGLEGQRQVSAPRPLRLTEARSCCTFKTQGITKYREEILTLLQCWVGSGRGEPTHLLALLPSSYHPSPGSRCLLAL